MLEDSNKAKQIILESLSSDYNQIVSLKKSLEENLVVLVNPENSFTNAERNEKLEGNFEILEILKNQSFDEYIRETKSFTCSTNTSSLYSHLSSLNTIQLEISSLSGVEFKRKFRRSYLNDSASKVSKSFDFTFRTKLSTRRDEPCNNNNKRNNRSISRSFINDFSRRINTESGLDELSTTLKDKSKLFSDRFFNTRDIRSSTSYSNPGGGTNNSRKGINHLIESLKRQSESFRTKSRFDRFSVKENKQFLV